MSQYPSNFVLQVKNAAQDPIQGSACLSALRPHVTFFIVCGRYKILCVLTYIRKLSHNSSLLLNAQCKIDCICSGSSWSWPSWVTLQKKCYRRWKAHFREDIWSRIQKKTVHPDPWKAKRPRIMFLSHTVVVTTPWRYHLTCKLQNHAPSPATKFANKAISQ